MRWGEIRRPRFHFRNESDRRLISILRSKISNHSHWIWSNNRNRLQSKNCSTFSGAFALKNIQRWTFIIIQWSKFISKSELINAWQQDLPQKWISRWHVYMWKFWNNGKLVLDIAFGALELLCWIGCSTPLWTMSRGYHPCTMNSPINTHPHPHHPARACH